MFAVHYKANGGMIGVQESVRSVAEIFCPLQIVLKGKVTYLENYPLIFIARK